MILVAVPRGQKTRSLIRNLVNRKTACPNHQSFKDCGEAIGTWGGSPERRRSVSPVKAGVLS